MSDKEFLRLEAMQRRKEAARDDSGMAARLVASRVVMLPELDKRKDVAGYHTMRDELDCIMTLKALHAAGFNISLPKIMERNKPLSFCPWDLNDDLIDGPFGTREPKGGEADPNVFLVPLLAFDEKGTRLGYGGGYYDRTLQKMRKEDPSIVAIGIAYDNQKLEALPNESYDQPLDMVVTEKKIYRFE